MLRVLPVVVALVVLLVCGACVVDGGCALCLGVSSGAGLLSANQAAVVRQSHAPPLQILKQFSTPAIHSGTLPTRC